MHPLIDLVIVLCVIGSPALAIIFVVNVSADITIPGDSDVRGEEIWAAGGIRDVVKTAEEGGRRAAVPTAPYSN